MERKRTPETPVERSPLIDPQSLRSCRSRSSPASRSLSSRSAGLNCPSIQRGSSTKISLKPISELGQQHQQQQHHQQQQQQQQRNAALNRSQSAPHHARSASAGPQYLLRSPQYRVNPVVKFDDCLVPKRMNYGIAGYNTSRRRSGSFSLNPEKTAGINPATTPRPRSFSGIPANLNFESRPRSVSSMNESRPRSVSSMTESRPRSLQTHHRPGPMRAVIWRSFARRVRDKMGRIRVRDTCSKLLSRLRG